ncbi:MAG: aldehyde dehydrogenase family protein, partial [Oscillospiraceae bacterium]
MSNAIISVPKPANEPILSYLSGSPERKKLKEELDSQFNKIVNIPLIINGEEIFTENTVDIVCPHDRHHILARCSIAGEKELKMAVDAALSAKEEWETFPWEQRAAIFLRCAELISKKYRYKINAATMLGQSKTAYQAEIDSACELIDFLRFNVFYAQEIYKQQPNNSIANWNKLAYRALEGFVVAVTPFNFTAIGANLGSAPALLGNTVLWKPATTAVLSNYYYMQILMEAGLPKGVMNFIPSKGKD